MKKLQLYIYGILLCVLSMGMGFPNIIMEKDLPARRKEAKKQISQPVRVFNHSEVYCTKAEKPCASGRTQQKSPRQVSNAALAVATLKDMYLKLFDKKGNLLLIENIKVEEFLGNNLFLEYLPEGSTFVMFHGNTAYYYIEQTGSDNT